MPSPPPDAPAARLRVLVVDDEPLARDCVRLALAAVGDVEVVAECGTGEEAVAAIEALAPDLVFLDVQMPGLDGFDVVAAVGPERMPPVVFVTAFDAHALRAFEVHALDYVLKPFDDARFRSALEHARRRLQRDRAEELARRLAALLEAGALGGTPGGAAPAAAGGRWLRRLHVPVRDRLRFVRVDDVDWFEGAGNYVRVHVGADRHLVRTSLARLEQELDPAHFVRIHRSTIVNLERVREVEPWIAGDYVAFLTDGRKLRVSRNYRDALLAAQR